MRRRWRDLLPTRARLLREPLLRARLVARLLRDRRVPLWAKGLPLLAALYFLVPDLAPGPIDDAVALWLGGYLFVELCPPEVVEEHRRALEGARNREQA